MTELSGNFNQDKRLIKLMVTQLYRHAVDLSVDSCRLVQIIVTMGDQGVLLYTVPPLTATAAAGKAGSTSRQVGKFEHYTAAKKAPVVQ